jgi:hypothetical protein
MISVKVTGKSRTISGVGCRRMTVSMKVTGKSYIISGLACRFMTVGKA